MFCFLSLSLSLHSSLIKQSIYTYMNKHTILYLPYNKINSPKEHPKRPRNELNMK